MKAFEHLSINGIQTRLDVKRVMEALKGVQDANIVFQKELEKKDREMNELKDQVRALKPFLDVALNLKDDEALIFDVKVIPRNKLKEAGYDTQTKLTDETNQD